MQVKPLGPAPIIATLILMKKGREEMQLACVTGGIVGTKGISRTENAEDCAEKVKLFECRPL